MVRSSGCSFCLSPRLRSPAYCSQDTRNLGKALNVFQLLVESLWVDILVQLQHE